MVGIAKLPCASVVVLSAPALTVTPARGEPVVESTTKPMSPKILGMPGPPPKPGPNGRASVLSAPPPPQERRRNASDAVSALSNILFIFFPL
jgi:hypothetical protein